MSGKMRCGSRPGVIFGIFLLPWGILNAQAKDFNILDYGAVADDQGLDTSAIQKAIQVCHEGGGGRVIVPEGTFLTETLRLAGKVDLHIVKNGVIKGSGDEATYGQFQSATTDSLLVNRWNRGLLIGEGLTGISISGEGVIDGNNVRDPEGEEGMRGPHTILLADCDQVRLTGVTIKDSGNYAFLIYSCSSVVVEKAVFLGGWDGVHFRGKPEAWNKDLTIRDCRFETGDDSVAGGYLEDSLMENCTVNTSCNGIRLIGPARRWTIRKCDFSGPGKYPHITQDRHNMLAGILLQPSAWGKQAGPVEDIVISDVTMSEVACAFQIVTKHKENPMRGIRISNLKATGIYEAASSVEAWEGAALGKVHLDSIDLTSVPKVFDRVAGLASKPAKRATPVPAWGLYIRGVEDLVVEDSKFQLSEDKPHAVPAFFADGVASLTVRRMLYPSSKNASPPFKHQGVKFLDESPAK